MRAGVLYLICFPGVDLFVRRPGYLRELPHYGPYYATWNHSSHSRNATCNDCHVPHENAVKKWFFKGMDGMRHASVFMMRGEPQVIQAIDESDGGNHE